MDTRICLRARVTELTEAQRLALAKAREYLRDHFPGETLRLYVPHTDAKARAEQRRRIARALAAGEPVASIAKREGVSAKHVRSIRGTFRAPLHP